MRAAIRVERAQNEPPRMISIDIQSKIMEAHSNIHLYKVIYSNFSVRWDEDTVHWKKIARALQHMGVSTKFFFVDHDDYDY